MRTPVRMLYDLMDKGSLRALSLLLALLTAGGVMWDPTRFANQAGQLPALQGLVLIWAVCCGVIHGVGFRPRKTRWQALFTPLPALLVLFIALYRYYL
ncbi:cyd operon protein YbgE [Pantoea sp. Bo_2]|uniref:cyd operon protein YbgE n=1 Tax=unclassified Pantoea TaxID=2630326 RepID=UPI001231C0DD|nr:MULTISPECIES: cyd operon protein YbgE [unclassified Pantoea]KAA5946968.1 cyd operon protein YbgE [Pantoea sp. VH_3]KAA5952219.1 cyd operon protein YbgE [Pantoea sp. VH_25]KAA5954386.1 cyd operon protein YbgE [Pantoea sp. VH_24]KAA5961496.1 cyd operon protein YbgE [Pantoea sp. VH_16]KAA5965632.1 cyd operon protein YbgE [Pantoea sp. VH_18]